MPTKINSSGNQQNYVPAGNGEASGEYADNATGSNIHYFATFAQPLPSSFSTKKTTIPKSKKADDKKGTTNKSLSKKDQIKKTLEDFNKKTVKAKDDSYTEITQDDLTREDKNGNTIYSIDKVLNKLGFNGLPQVVDKETFDAACKESSFVAIRGIGASSKAVLQAYIDQLYHGDFYVNCSQGGAQYGQGMYCAADYTGKLSQGAKTEAQNYANWNGKVGGTVQLTLAKDAKIIKHKDLITEFDKRLQSDPKAVDFVARSISQKLNYNYDKMPQDLKDFINHEIEYRINGDVKLHKKLNKQETQDAKNKIYHMEYAKQPMWSSSKTIATQGSTIANNIRDSIKKFKEGLTANQNTWNYGGNAQVSNACDAIGVNDGVLAASMGYDAINAENHGKSGSYTVILNRTKCLFLKD